MADGATAITTGLFTLAGALGGATLSMLGALLIARRNDRRHDHQELRRERIRVYARFLQEVSAADTSSEFLYVVVRNNSGDQMDKAWSQAASAVERVVHAYAEVQLFAGQKVLDAGQALVTLVQENYQARGHNREGVTITDAHREATRQMQAEIGLL